MSRLTQVGNDLAQLRARTRVALNRACDFFKKSTGRVVVAPAVQLHRFGLSTRAIELADGFVNRPVSRLGRVLRVGGKRPRLLHWFAPSLARLVSHRERGHDTASLLTWRKVERRDH